MIGDVIICKHVTTSTNDDVKNLFSGQHAEGTVVMAYHQTSGRGQKGEWLDCPGQMLLMSVLLRPNVQLSRHSELTLMAAQAVCAMVQEQGLAQAYVKHPNDVYCASQKLAGVLLETSSQGAIMDCAALGIGLNVNGSKEFFEKQGLGEATSLFLQSGQTYALERMLIKLLPYLDLAYQNFKAKTLNG